MVAADAECSAALNAVARIKPVVLVPTRCPMTCLNDGLMMSSFFVRLYFCEGKPLSPVHVALRVHRKRRNYFSSSPSKEGTAAQDFRNSETFFCQAASVLAKRHGSFSPEALDCADSSALCGRRQLAAAAGCSAGGTRTPPPRGQVRSGRKAQTSLSSPKLAALAKHGRPFSQNVMRSSIATRRPGSRPRRICRKAAANTDRTRDW